MSINELSAKADEIIEAKFSERTFYDSVLDSVDKIYEEECRKQKIEGSLVLKVNILGEEILKTAISESVKQTINLLFENGFFQVSD